MQVYEGNRAIVLFLPDCDTRW